MGFTLITAKDIRILLLMLFYCNLMKDDSNLPMFNEQCKIARCRGEILVNS